MKSASQLGIVDWGIGGISIHRLIKEKLGNISIVYMSDTGAIPYGKMSRPELVNRLHTVIEFMRSRAVTHLVFGCNAASTAIPFLNTNGMKVEGIIESAIRLAAQKRPTRLGLIGGDRTVRSGVYRRGLGQRGIKVEQRIAQPLSGMIESGDTSSEKLHEQCRTILAPLKDCSHVLLACTHYPAIAQVMRRHVSPQTVFIDPAAELVRTIKSWRLNTGGTDVFLTTGDPDNMKAAALNAFGFNIRKVRKARLQDF